MTAKPRRRWFQYSLKSLMVLVVVVAIPCGWLKWKMVRKDKERAAVAEIKKLGFAGYYDCGVKYDWEFDKQDNPPGAEWLRKLLGEDFFSDVVGVWIGGGKVNDEWLHHLDCLTQLRDINVRLTYVTDTGLHYLTRFRKLQALDLSQSGITDAGMAHLEECHDLTELWILDTAVTDAGLVHLRGLHKLQQVWLYGTGVTDAGVADLQKSLPKCHFEVKP